ncbi:MAG: glycerophosphodiester phosphodiesterase [Actinomycetota bacterium]|nr:glycerophosphodiester phosphodiesterase [Actinomycetota bacterium]
MTISVRCARQVAVVAALLVPMVPGAASARSSSGEATADQQGFTIYGHRGAAGYRPEHTIGSYTLAARMGADYIEPDLVSTKDHVLVVRHDPEIGETTDVADHPEFADRKTTKTIDYDTVTGWFTQDFTLAELKTLRAKERLPAIRQHNTLWNGRYQILTFQEFIDLRDKLQRELHRSIGIIPELKHSTYFRSIGLPLEEPFVRTLKRNDIADGDGLVTVQSFEVANLKRLHKKLPEVPLVQLLDSQVTHSPGDVKAAGGSLTYGDMATPAGLRDIAEYAQIVSPDKSFIVPRDQDQRSLAPTSFVGDAHAAGLQVVPYTFRAENIFLPLELRVGTVPSDTGNLFGEISQFVALGIDGLFTDNADVAKAVRDADE